MVVNTSFERLVRGFALSTRKMDPRPWVAVTSVAKGVVTCLAARVGSQHDWPGAGPDQMDEHAWTFWVASLALTLILVSHAGQPLLQQAEVPIALETNFLACSDDGRHDTSVESGWFGRPEQAERVRPICVNSAVGRGKAPRDSWRDSSGGTKESFAPLSTPPATPVDSLRQAQASRLVRA